MNNFSLSFYENTNSTHQVAILPEAHDIFVKYDGCSSIHGMPIEDQCNFSKTEPSCEAKRRYLDYIYFAFCVVQVGKSSILDIVLLIFLAFLAFYYFQLMAAIAGKLFIPSLNYVAKTFRMSQSLAGATILAMANTVGGFFLAFSDMMADFTGMFNATFGGALFQLTVVAGVVLVVKPFHIFFPFFLRDNVFLMALTTYIDYIMKDQTVNAYEGAALLLYYVLFMCVVIIDTEWIRELSRDVRRKIKLLEEGEASDDLRRELALLENEGVMEILAKDSKSIIDVNTTKSALFDGKSANENLFRQFIDSINPIEAQEWRTSNCFMKAIIVIRAPVFFFYLISCPRVDFSRPNHGWSKLLNVFHIWSAPQFLIVMSRMRRWWFHGLHLSVYTTCASLPLMVIVFFTSRTDVAPVYHLAYALVAVFMSISMTRMVALEIVSVTTTIGVISQMSPSLVASTLTAWEGGLGALIANVTLAFRGYPRMAFSACYGGPLLSIPVAFGVRLLYKSLHSPGKVSPVHRGPLAGILYAILFLSIFYILMAIMLTKNKGRKSIGILSLVIYPLFLFFALLTEFEVIHGHSTDHTDQRVQMD